jgi:hypothetical protein
MLFPGEGASEACSHDDDDSDTHVHDNSKEVEASGHVTQETAAPASRPVYRRVGDISRGMMRRIRSVESKVIGKAKGTAHVTSSQVPQTDRQDKSSEKNSQISQSTSVSQPNSGNSIMVCNTLVVNGGIPPRGSADVCGTPLGGAAPPQTPSVGASAPNRKSYRLSEIKGNIVR